MIITGGTMNRWPVIIGVLLICQFIFADSAKASEPFSIDIAGTVAELRNCRVADGETSIPTEIRPLLTVLKHQLRDLISVTINSHVSESKSLEGLRNAISDELEKQGIHSEIRDIVVIVPDSANDSYTYGDIYQIAIHKVDGQPDLIAATTTIGVCCGDDTSLYIYQQTNEGWKLVVAQEANDYEEVSGAHGSFGFAISPSSKAGQFFVVTKNVNPWCVSNWQSIRYEVLRPGMDPYEPKVLLKQSHTIFLGNFSIGVIDIKPTGFTIQFEGRQRLSTSILTRRHVVSYQVQGEQVRRVPPFADGPEGFLDEWFDLPWEEASKWIDSSAAASLRALHARFRLDRTEGDSAFDTEFAFDPPTCRIGPGQWQVGIDFTPSEEGGLLPKGMSRKMYFTIIQKNENYILKGVSRSSLPKCRLQKAYWL